MILDVKNWQRLGVLVVAARVAKGWDSTIEWSKHAGVNHQTLHLIERGRGGNFSRTTIRKVEVSLDWAPGSWDAILADGDPEILALEPSDDVTVTALDEEAQAWLAVFDDLSDAERAIIKNLADQLRGLDG